MSRAFALAAVAVLSIASHVAWAQQPIAPAPVNPADGECTTTTTTTTRCTGAAAPYAAHPAPAPLIAPAPSLSLVPCPVVIPHGWNLQQDPDGTWWRTRKHHGVAAWWAPGLTIWMLGFFGGTMAGLGTNQPYAMLPIAGPFMASAFSSSAQGVALWAVDGVAQLGGLVLFIVGASMDGKLERLPITLTPTSLYGGGGGVALTGHFE